MNEAPKRREALVAVYITRKTLLLGFAGVAACAVVYGVFSETLTMTAFYPSPYGAYAQLLSTQGSSFARDTGGVSIGGDSTGKRNGATSGNVLTVYGNAALVNNANVAASPTLSIGSTNDGSLNVNGTANVTGNITAASANFATSVRVGDDTASCAANKAGSLRYHAAALEVCNGSAWVSFATVSAADKCVSTTGGTWDSSSQMCYFSGTSCPGNWTPTGYTSTHGATCSGCNNSCSAFGSCTSCTTTGHTRSSTTDATCTYYSPYLHDGCCVGFTGCGPVKMTSDAYTCGTSVYEVGCQSN